MGVGAIIPDRRKFPEPLPYLNAPLSVRLFNIFDCYRLTFEFHRNI